jgi:hypothetical protein
MRYLKIDRGLWAVALVGAVMLGGRADAIEGKGGEGAAAPGGFDTGSSLGQEATSRAGAGYTGRAVSEAELGGLIDRLRGKPGKWFDVGATWETHGLLWENNTSASQRKLFNFFYAYASLNLTRNDRIRIREGFYFYTLADQTESGVRATDLSISYGHLFRLPKQFMLRGTVALTAPVSFYSQKEGLYTAPTVAVSLSRVLPKGFYADFGLFGGGYLQKYKSAGGYDATAGVGGSANPAGIFGGSLEVEYSAWFHKPLVLGVDGYTAWLWYHTVGQDTAVTNGNDYGYGPNTTPGVVATSGYQHQPVQQLYGFEVFLRYSPPAFYGIHTDLTLALAEGDPTLGYVSRNIDGVSHFFDDYFRTFELYGSVAARY